MKRYGPLAGFAVVSVLFLISQVFAQRAPRVDSLEPPVVDPGQELVIRGSHFGADPGNATLLIAGVTITRSQILSWEDQAIRVKVLDSLGSGLVSITTKEGTSRGLLLTSRKDLPRLKDAMEGNRGAVVRTFLPLKVRPSDELTLKGNFLGGSSSSGQILFPWGPVKDPGSASGGDASWIRVSQNQIILWNQDEIRLRVPEGAKSGPLKILYKNSEIMTPALEVDDQAASRAFHSRRVLSFSYSFDLVVQKAEEGAEVQVWAPAIPERAAQRKVQVLSESLAPAVSPYPQDRLDLYRFNQVSSGLRTRVTRDFQAELYAQEVSLKPELMVLQTGTSSGGETAQASLQADSLIPSSSPEVAAAAAKARGGETQAYFKATALYRWLLSTVTLDLDRQGREPLESLRAGRGNVFELAVLYTALARASQVPARLLGGYVVTGPKSLKPHFWCEIRLPGAGWIPVDPALAAGLKYGAYPEVPDPKTFYFGNMDNRHLAVSEDVSQIPRSSARSTVKSQGLPGSLQNISEEVLGNLENYSLIWHDVTVTGNY